MSGDELRKFMDLFEEYPGSKTKMSEVIKLMAWPGTNCTDVVRSRFQRMLPSACLDKESKTWYLYGYKPRTLPHTSSHGRTLHAPSTAYSVDVDMLAMAQVNTEPADSPHFYTDEMRSPPRGPRTEPEGRFIQADPAGSPYQNGENGQLDASSHQERISPEDIRGMQEDIRFLCSRVEDLEKQYIALQHFCLDMHDKFSQPEEEIMCAEDVDTDLATPAHVDQIMEDDSLYRQQAGPSFSTAIAWAFRKITGR
jgi:hypothetical protein